ncbi:MAG: glycoside hydrolase family 9 protein [Bacteroidales bacterium]|nr:glycoside hydrolase family 9 protein [Bacteroidales bacterium]
MKIANVFLLLWIGINLSAQRMSIFINQLGYYPGSNKIAIVKQIQPSTFSVIRLVDSTIVYEGSLSKVYYDSDSGDSVRWADFSSLKTEGEYIIRLSSGESSLPFRISSQVLREVSYASLRSYYYQRCSYELLPQYAGLWSRKAGHPDTSVIYHTSTGRTGTGRSPKGWYDAGDYGKYTVNAGISVANLLQLFELIPSYFSDSTVSIPESGNGINDLLDEVRFELDWLATMQDHDGGVFHKVTTANFSGFIMPDADIAERFFIGKGTAATLDFAAMMAMAGRIYRPFDSAFADSCVAMARRAWQWAVANPNVAFKNPSGINTGEYGDNTFSDEFIWAASELFITTGDPIYSQYLQSKATSLQTYTVPGWPNVAGLGLQSLATVPNTLEASLKDKIKSAIISRCNTLKSEINSGGYRISRTGFFWGCNGAYAQAGVTLIYGFLLTNDSSYLQAAVELSDFLLGKNATGYSFFTYYGSVPVMNPHHRPSYADNIVMPIPGFLSGGPNPGRQDNVPYAYLQPAKSFSDVMESYASNEVAINWNAPATFLLAAIDFYLGDKQKYICNPIVAKPNCPPSITLSYPVFGASIKQTDSVRLQFTLNDPDKNAAFVEIYIDGKYFVTVPANTKTLKLAPMKVGEHVISLYAFDAEGKGHEKSTRFKIVPVVSVNVEKNSKFLNIYPNPAENMVMLTILPPTNGTLRIEIHSLDGKNLLQNEQKVKAKSSVNIPIDLTPLTVGTYVVTAYLQNQQLASAKMIVGK